MRIVSLGTCLMLLAPAAFACEPIDLYCAAIERTGPYALSADAAVPKVSGKPVWFDAKAAGEEYKVVADAKPGDVVGVWRQVDSSIVETIGQSRPVSDGRLDVTASGGRYAVRFIDENIQSRVGELNAGSLEFNFYVRRSGPHAVSDGSVHYSCKMANHYRMVCLAQWSYSWRTPRQAESEAEHGSQTAYLAYAREGKRIP